MFRWIVPTLAAMIAASPAAAQTSGLSLSFLGQQVLPTAQSFSGTTVGGLSGIDYDPVGKRYIAISDDQTNARFYNLDLTLSPSGFTGVSVTGVTSFRSPTGGTYAPGTIDPESIRFTPSGNVVYSSEGFANAGVNPFVREARIDGSYVRDFTLPAYYAPTGTSGIRNNLAFESLTLANGGTTLVTALENALVQDGPASTGSTGSPSRILAFNLATGLPLSEYVYQNDAVAVPPVGSNFAVNGLVELLALGGTQYLALERSFTVGAPGTGYAIKLYGIDTAGATDVLGRSSLAGATFTPVAKSLLFDFGALGIPLDNIEGITFGQQLSDGRRSLVVVADDNFASSQFQQVLAFAVGSTSAVPEPATWAFMIAGIGIAGTALRRPRRSARLA